MDYDTFLGIVLLGSADDVADAHGDPLCRAGALAGLAACRDRTPAELRAVWALACERREAALAEVSGNYPYYQCFREEVEWILDCVSAWLRPLGLPPLGPGWPTEHAEALAAELVARTGGAL